MREKVFEPLIGKSVHDTIQTLRSYRKGRGGAWEHFITLGSGDCRLGTRNGRELGRVVGRVLQSSYVMDWFSFNGD